MTGDGQEDSDAGRVTDNTILMQDGWQRTGFRCRTGDGQRDFDAGQMTDNRILIQDR